MAIIHIPDALDMSLQQIADRLKVPKDDLIRNTLANNLDNYSDIDTNPSESEIALMDERVAELRRGETISSEAAETWFENLRIELNAR